jgi:hypothetical protein
VRTARTFRAVVVFFFLVNDNDVFRSSFDEFFRHYAIAAQFREARGCAVLWTALIKWQSDCPEYLYGPLGIFLPDAFFGRWFQDPNLPAYGNFPAFPDCLEDFRA